MIIDEKLKNGIYKKNRSSIYNKKINKLLEDYRLAMDFLKTKSETVRLKSLVKNVKRLSTEFKYQLDSFEQDESKINYSSRISHLTTSLAFNSLTKLLAFANKELNEITDQINNDEAELLLIAKNDEVATVCKMTNGLNRKEQFLISETLFRMAEAVGSPTNLIKILRKDPNLTPWDFGRAFDEASLIKRLQRHKKKYHL